MNEYIFPITSGRGRLNTVKERSFAERDPIQPAWLSHRTFTHLVDILCAVSKPVLITVYSVRYHLLGPPVSRWSLSTYLLTRLDRFRMGLSQLGPLSPPQVGPFEVPPGTDRHGVEVIPVRLAPVHGVEVPGFMFTPPAAVGQGLEVAKEGEKVVMHLHGGGYVGGSHCQDRFPYEFCKSLGVRSLGVNYRKCLASASAFPGPILDALAGYIHLTSILSFAPEDFILVGESAGGHLALALSRYLAEANLPQPGLIALSSPWARHDLLVRVSHDQRRHRLAHHNKGADAARVLRAEMALAGAERWECLRETKVYIMTGTREVIFDEDVSLARSMEAAGVDVLLREDVDGCHVGAGRPLNGEDVFSMFVRDVQGLLRRAAGLIAD
ncbi:hypothetical protein JCM24511_00322 [Saitozyma sp. JCM 24511]|nr:hypothetical protein JCM24511_00322 [Saitozyma sp. JCM 24511]